MANHLFCVVLFCFVFFPREAGSLEFFVRSPKFKNVFNFVIQIINKKQDKQKALTQKTNTVGVK